MNSQNPKPISESFIAGGIINAAPQSQQSIAQQETPVTTPMDTTSSFQLTEDELLKLKKINFKKKISGKEKRVRQNRKLFRMLTPRNAIAALNELHSTSLNDSIVIPSNGNKFSAKVTINNIKYEGLGNSKVQAKNAACEKALRDLVIKKLQTAKNQEVQAAESSEEIEDEKDEVPMLQLASYALHKLFTEWESEGFDIPFLKPPPPPTDAQPSTNPSEAKSNTPKPPKVRNELPPGNDTMHPVMLLSVMRPGTQYIDLGNEGISPSIVHKVGTTVDNQQFIDQARSKKEARKKVATVVLRKIFNWQGAGL